MAFTVGWPDGLSIVSVAYADEYFADRGVVAWAGVDNLKQGALVRATDYIKTMFALRFDPELFVDADSNPITPEELEVACCEYALVELKTPGGLAPAPQVDASGYAMAVTKKKIGPIEKTFSVIGGDSAVLRTRRIFPIPDALIASLLLPATAFTRVTR